MLIGVKFWSIDIKRFLSCFGPCVNWGETFDCCGYEFGILGIVHSQLDMVVFGRLLYPFYSRENRVFYSFSNRAVHQMKTGPYEKLCRSLKASMEY